MSNKKYVCIEHIIDENNNKHEYDGYDYNFWCVKCGISGPCCSDCDKSSCYGDLYCTHCDIKINSTSECYTYYHIENNKYIKCDYFPEMNYEYMLCSDIDKTKIIN